MTTGAQSQTLLNETPQQKEKRMEWFQDAKLGVFIHWGIYSVRGVAESWSFYNKYLSYDEYMSQLNGFTAKNYNPEEWAELIKESGAQYTV
ncbi:MAG: alpha-L-fucosidase, partial [Tannerellaceae bacterium]